MAKRKPYKKHDKPMSEEHRRKLSEAHRGKPRPDLKGKKQSQETRDKKSKAMKGKKITFKDSEKRNENLRESLKGKPCPNKGKKQSEEWVQKRADSLKGNPNLGVLPPDKLVIKTTKQYLTRKNNNTFNTSKVEEELYQQLLEEYESKTILRQYKDERYPFYCDFYIVEDDLFIELNHHWTHGPHPFNPESKEDQSLLDYWKEKAKVSQFYRNAIEIWTVRDVEKQKVAKENNLNYKVIYGD